MLVTANDLLQLFFGWEGVGLLSYLLIGFWYDRPSANDAAIKAFVMNRIGDLGFAVGIALVFFLFGSIRFDVIFRSGRQSRTTPSYYLFGTNLHALDVIGILLFIGAMGKSAQLGLHPLARGRHGRSDAGLCPHPCRDDGDRRRLSNGADVAAAGIRAGGDSRSSASSAARPPSLQRRLAAPRPTSSASSPTRPARSSATCLSRFPSAPTRPRCSTSSCMPSSRRLLFLTAGSVIHAMSGEQDMRQDGRPRPADPLHLYHDVDRRPGAHAGIPPLSGFFSKDAIIDSSDFFGRGGGYACICVESRDLPDRFLYRGASSS